jgi:hypothetical protein
MVKLPVKPLMPNLQQAACHSFFVEKRSDSGVFELRPERHHDMTKANGFYCMQFDIDRLLYRHI